MWETQFGKGREAEWGEGGGEAHKCITFESAVYLPGFFRAAMSPLGRHTAAKLQRFSTKAIFLKI